MNLLWIFLGIIVLLLGYLLWNQTTRKTTLNNIQEYVLKIAYIVSAPFVVLIQFCYELMKTLMEVILKILQLLLIPFKSASLMISHVDEKYGEYLHSKMNKEYTAKQIREQIQAYKDVLIKDKHTLITISIQIVVLLGTVFLQYVSFATTYRGISFYFQEMAPGAAALITLVIQGSLLVLANAIVHRQRFTAGRTLMLIYFMLTSMFFSFTGIVNQEISPEIDIRKNYSAFYKDYENLRNDVLSKSTQTSDTFSVSSIVKDINNLKSSAKSMQSSIEQSLQTHQEQLNGSYKISYDENGFPIYDTTQKDSTLVALVDKETQQINRLQQLNEALQSDQLDIAILSDASFEQKDLEEKMKLLNDTGTHYEEVKQNYDNLAQYMKSVDSGLQLKELPATLGNYYRSFALQKQLETSKCMDYDTLREQITSRKTDMTNVSDILQLQSLITREVTDNFINTDLSDETISSDSEYYSSAMSLAQKAMQFEDINLVALARLHPSHKDFATALFLLALAIFVDGTTVLMPYFMNKTRKTILYAKKRKDMRFEEEDILSDLFMGISSDPQSVYQKIEALLSIFVIVPYLQDKGYAMMCTERELHQYLSQQGSELRDTVLFLQHCGYLVYTTKETMQILRKESGLEEIEMEHVYLIQTKLIIWLKQNAAYANHIQIKEV